ncbi:CPBP family intramembrane glutamic endopeptidase [Allonocardiopsis opalescens]|uniref:CAAX prenyl protease 2/Lysostaphin resistance protein A-like domain-containing protein n=1 Tax=Allonocardiopsis opalescens TaxID=1144618 RepID=A0A2T0PWY7_9ACTN|nr:CPBP family intramembrane glutamic endopeptidase [Allonocardiopsis opalescens]PRX96059.1 hypothetical protein CLV72_10863 [Allonocardiopsis opalescens]
MPPDLLAYAARILPGLLLIAWCFALARRGGDPLPRIAVLLLGFVLLRDAMTPTGLWRLGSVDGVLVWLRFTENALTLVLLGLGTLAATGALLRFDPELRALVRWGRADAAAVALGLGGGLAAAAPVLALNLLWPVHERGGAVALGLLPVLAFFSLSGNLAEEVLFRGFLQGRMEPALGPARAALGSAVLFAACHVFLASTVTGAGWPLLAFTLYEGLICAALRMRRGVLPAALAHGTAIFLLGAGLP